MVAADVEVQRRPRLTDNEALFRHGRRVNWFVTTLAPDNRRRKGLFGPQTRAAIADYQRANGLAETAAIDQPTLQSLGMT